ncbi:MAG TPA: hypothetical protein QF694_01585 [Dehalococcoidia bacterium]|jgi:hypothetical protein|nr:hypothetical protein [Chloroflexota bacterium]MDP6055359.1 hypothetical protein [Dehalococcoidia bacterium]MDP7261790.1 hypothetical protein [Dehalococcoidia bacterium]MDP7486277.1 hypothetical protein [Dehalococcoidia bacterium]HJP27487.1 hypothetical protein [Dehalococcoidia bacterium]
MIKTKDVTLVALATLLTEFVTSCSSADTPSIEDIPSSSAADTVGADDDLSGLTSAQALPKPTAATIEPTATSNAILTSIPITPRSLPQPQPSPSRRTFSKK